jgi:hypothetical protein
MVINLLLISSLSFAQDFQNIQQGQVAPFTGTIITPDGIAKIITIEDAKLKTCQEEWKHEINNLTISKDTEIEKLKNDLKITNESKDKLISEKDEEIKRTYELIKKQNKNIVPLWIGLGFVGGITSTLGTIYAYEAITND